MAAAAAGPLGDGGMTALIGVDVGQKRAQVDPRTVRLGWAPPGPPRIAEPTTPSSSSGFIDGFHRTLLDEHSRIHGREQW